MAWRALRWWLPWLLTLGVSSALAYVAEAGLEHSAQATATRPASTSLLHAQQWLIISSRAPDDRIVTLRCLTQQYATGADQVWMDYSEFNHIVEEICDEVWSDQS